MELGPHLERGLKDMTECLVSKKKQKQKGYRFVKDLRPTRDLPNKGQRYRTCLNIV